MQWLTPMAGAIAAAITVPTLVLMYFLKLRRREVIVPSTFLWKRAVQDLQVNAPFQRLRRNLLLLLQLLALAALLVALARPVLSLRTGGGERIVLLIDRSASMNATDVAPSRLELAKQQAKAVVESIRSQGAFDLGGRGDQAMVIAFDSRPRLMCNFTSDKDRLLAAIDAISPGEGGSRLGDAVQVARAYAQPPGEDANDRSAEPAARLELFSDGRIVDLSEVVVREGELRLHCLGESSDNVGITAMEARRSYENPNDLKVFVSLANAGPQAVDCDVQLSLNNDVRAVRKVHIEAAAPVEEGGRPVPGVQSVMFSLTHGGAGVIEVRHLRPDVLAADDAVWAVLQRPKRLAVALVTAGNLALNEALKACPLARLDVLTPGEYAAADAARLGEYDAVVLDRHAPAKLARGRYLVFGRPPLGIEAPEVERGEFVVDWSASHPVLEYVNLANVYAAKHYKLPVGPDTTVLAEFSDSAAIAVLRRAGSTLVTVGFEIDDTNWPFDPAFVMFCYNAANFLGTEAGASRSPAMKVGEPINVQGGAPGRPGVVTAPGGVNTKLQCDSGGMFRYGATSRVGVYRLAIEGKSAGAFAVNLVDGAESDIAPAREIVLAGEPVTAQSAAPRRENREIWPWLVGLALALVCLEWVVYNSKVRL